MEVNAVYSPVPNRIEHFQICQPYISTLYGQLIISSCSAVLAIYDSFTGLSLI
jgi:hypothetical protein